MKLRLKIVCLDQINNCIYWWILRNSHIYKYIFIYLYVSTKQASKLECKETRLKNIGQRWILCSNITNSIRQKSNWKLIVKICKNFYASLSNSSKWLKITWRSRHKIYDVRNDHAFFFFFLIFISHLLLLKINTNFT